MPTVISPLITDAGLNAAVNAQANGLQLQITHVVLGQGQYTPNATTTTGPALRKEKVSISGAVRTGVGGFMVTVYLNAYTGAAYGVGELLFYAGDPDAGGVLFAVFSLPASTIFQRNSLDWVGQFAITLARVPAGSVSVTVDPNGAQSVALLSQHEGKSDPHPQYVRHLAPGAALPTANEGAIWHPDYNSLMTWQVFNANGANYTGYASIDIGWLRPDTVQAPRTGWIKTGATGFPTTMALYHWAKHNGLMQTTEWVQGTLFYKDNGNGTFVTPDVRGEHPRFWDDSRGVESGRAFGSWVDWQLAIHNHMIWGDINGGNGGSGRVPSVGQSGIEQWIYTENTGGGAENRVRTTAFPGVIKF